MYLLIEKGDESMKRTLNSVTGVVLSAILFILLGLVLLIWPEIASRIVCYALGGLILLFALFCVVRFFTDKKVYFIFNFDLVVGLIAAGMGIFMLIRPDLVISILPFVVGLFLVFSSILDFQKTFLLRNYGNSRWKSSLVFTCIKLVFGIVLLCLPLLIAQTLVRLIGIGLMYNGLSELWIVSRWPKTDEHYTGADKPE
jgi:uncharacterized membrane protein HdeD (DUF308 family)